jgi:hypothetical protein
MDEMHGRDHPSCIETDWLVNREVFRRLRPATPRVELQDPLLGRRATPTNNRRTSVTCLSAAPAIEHAL